VPAKSRTPSLDTTPKIGNSLRLEKPNAALTYNAEGREGLRLEKPYCRLYL
jgi:hypothetical protein